MVLLLLGVHDFHMHESCPCVTLAAWMSILSHLVLQVPITVSHHFAQGWWTFRIAIILPTFSHTAHHIHMALYKVRLGWTRLHLWHFFLFLSQTKISIIAHVYMCLSTTSRIPYMAILVQPLHLAHFNRYCMFADIWPLCLFLVMPPWMMWPPNPMCCVDKHGFDKFRQKDWDGMLSMWQLTLVQS